MANPGHIGDVPELYQPCDLMTFKPFAPAFDTRCLLVLDYGKIRLNMEFYGLAMPVEMREMRREDIPRVMEIERECFPTPWHESAYITELANRSAYYVVACKDGRITGFAGMWIIMDEAHITTIGVARDSRGEKIGERLLVGLLEEAIYRGAKRATLEVRQSNEVAQNLYRKYEFAPAAIRRGYYTDNHENAVVMWIDDMSAPTWRKKYRTLKQELNCAKVTDTPTEDVT
ncbi:MAG: ribosomal protein S18-alanine N-acetyltransferase [Armatimonadota bacterium]|nr:ribosomal protein S18-alanine N-acetyltransferase [bacterium]